MGRKNFSLEDYFNALPSSNEFYNLKLMLCTPFDEFLRIICDYEYGHPDPSIEGKMTELIVLRRELEKYMKKFAEVSLTFSDLFKLLENNEQRAMRTEQ